MLTVVIATSHRAASAAAAPLDPLRGDPSAAADARLLTAPLDRFGLALLAREAQTSSGNVVVSPLSIHDVLSMILNGAQGRTAAEMRRALGLEGLSLPATDQAWADLIAATQAGRRPAVQIADSLWLRDGVAFNPAFLTAGRDYFAAATLPLPTDPDRAADAVNGWVDGRTAGMIKQIVSPGDFSSATILAVVNTVHLKAAWQTAVRPQPHATRAVRPRRRLDGTGADHERAAHRPGRADARLRRRSPRHQGPGHRLGDRAARRPDARLAAGPVRAPRSWARSTRSPVPGRSCSTCRACTRPSRLPTSSPRLQALGMVAAFSPQQAELQGIVAPGAQGRVYIERVVHKAVLDVNENGIEAAAATAGIVGITAEPVAPLTIRADHPFLMLLTEKSTSAPLFMALIRDPRA